MVTGEFMVIVISLGGSIVAPSNPDVDFIVKFATYIKEYLKEDKKRQVILTIGGGGLARSYINAYKDVMKETFSNVESFSGDMIGIMATRLNAELVKSVFATLCSNPVVYDPTIIESFEGRVLVAAGWKPGFSTDTDAVILAERFKSEIVINLSNITKVYTKDPKEDPTATPIDEISWDNFIKMIGTEWIPGKNVPFDPIASQKAQKAKIKVICANGRDIENLKNILEGKSFIGTTIG